MLLVDSHCHLDCLDLSRYDGDLSHVMTHAREQSVHYFLCVCITLNNFPEVLRIATLYPDVSASVGLHPNEGPFDTIPDLTEQLISMASHAKVVAIGETGLDYFRTSGDIEWQQHRFRQHIQAAKSVKLPLIVHTRNAKVDTLQMMREEHADTVGGVMHCFTEDWDTAKAALDMGFYISFSGIVTFRNAVDLQKVAQQVPLDRILIETDSPYLAPVPHRGQPNEPAFVRHVAEFLATLRGISLDSLAEATTHNFFRLFSKIRG